MRRGAILLTCLLAGCSAEAPTGVYQLDSTQALLAKRTVAKNYTAVLSGSGEFPPNDSQARGVAHFQLSADGQSIEYRLIVANIDNLLMAHIHIFPVAAGNVVVWLYPDSPPPQLISGTTNGVLAEGTITASDLVGQLAGDPLEDLLAAMNAGNTYVNVHTTARPGGEIAGVINPGG